MQGRRTVNSDKWEARPLAVKFHRFHHFQRRSFCKQNKRPLICSLAVLYSVSSCDKSGHAARKSPVSDVPVDSDGTIPCKKLIQDAAFLHHVSTKLRELAQTSCAVCLPLDRDVLQTTGTSTVRKKRQCVCNKAGK